MGRIETIDQINALSRTANQEWFATDLDTSALGAQGQKWTVGFSIDAASVVEYTLDSGTTWYSFKENANHVVDAGYEYTLIVDGDDTVNFRATLATTVNYCRVYIS